MSERFKHNIYTKYSHFFSVPAQDLCRAPTLDPCTLHICAGQAPHPGAHSFHLLGQWCPRSFPQEGLPAACGLIGNSLSHLYRFLQVTAQPISHCLDFCLPFFPLSLLPVVLRLPSSKLIGQLPRWCAGFKSSAREGEAVFNYNQCLSRDWLAWNVELWHREAGEAWWPAPAPPRSVTAVASCVDVPCSHQHTGRLLVRVHTGYLLVRLRFIPTTASSWVQREVLAAEAEHQTPKGNQNTDWCRQISPLIFTSNCFHCEKKIII